MERQVLDFFIALGNSRANAGALGTFRIHRMISDPEVMNGRMVCNFNAVDVPVRKSGAWWFFKKSLGQQTVAGGLDLEQQRRASFSADSVYQIKIGKPNVYLGFPDEYDDMPESIKKDPLLSLVFKLYYDAKHSEQTKTQIMSDAGIQKTEQQDILAQSITKTNQFIISTFKNFTENEESDLRQKLAQGQDGGQQGSQPKKEYY